MSELKRRLSPRSRVQKTPNSCFPHLWRPAPPYHFSAYPIIISRERSRLQGVNPSKVTIVSTKGPFTVPGPIGNVLVYAIHSKKTSPPARSPAASRFPRGSQAERCGRRPQSPHLPHSSRQSGQRSRNFGRLSLGPRSCSQSRRHDRLLRRPHPRLIRRGPLPQWPPHSIPTNTSFTTKLASLPQNKPHRTEAGGSGTDCYEPSAPSNTDAICPPIGGICLSYVRGIIRYFEMARLKTVEQLGKGFSRYAFSKGECACELQWAHTRLLP